MRPVGAVADNHTSILWLSYHPLFVVRTSEISSLSNLRESPRWTLAPQTSPCSWTWVSSDRRPPFSPPPAPGNQNRLFLGVGLFQIPSMSEITQSLSLSVRLVSLGLTPSRVIPVVVFWLHPSPCPRVAAASAQGRGAEIAEAVISFPGESWLTHRVVLHVLRNLHTVLRSGCHNSHSTRFGD